MGRSRFHGEIFGVGTSSGVRVVVGHWTESPLGEFTDIMIEFDDGRRLLIAPSESVREFVSATYTFDDTLITPVTYSSGPPVRVVGGPLTLDITVGRVTPLGRLLRLVPRSVSTAPWFCSLTDPIARVVLRGVRTKGSAGGGRREYYGARDQRRVLAVTAKWLDTTGLDTTGEVTDLGSLTPVTPPVRFGFGSTPAAPTVTAITTTIDEG